MSTSLGNDAFIAATRDGGGGPGQRPLVKWRHGGGGGSGLADNGPGAAVVGG
jgi:hypothetical protein